MPLKARLRYRQNWRYLAAVLICWLAYAVLTVLAPLHGNTYHVTRLELALLQLTIIVPLLVIWLLAANGAASFKRYARLIRRSDDGRALNLVSTGLLLVVLCFVLQSLLGVIPSYLIGTKLVGPMVAAENEVSLAVALAAYVVIFVGALRLRKLSIRRLSTGGLTTILFPYCLLAIIYGSYFYTQIPQPMVNGMPKFALEGKLPFYTLALPYILTWLLGILAITIIAEYARTVSGTIYRRALKDLVRGITVVLGYSILVQLLELSSKFLAGLSLGPILTLLYAILVLYSTGFVFIAQGASKLTLIELTL